MKKLKYDDDLEKIVTAIFGVIGIIAILINLYFKGFEKENILDAIKDLAGLVVVIAVFILANRMRNRSKSFLDAGSNALTKLKSNNEDILIGPTYDKEDYDPKDEKKSNRMKYIFFKPGVGSYKKKVAFIPLEPIEQGIIDIRLSKGTLDNWGIKKTLEDAQKIIYAAVSKKVEERYKGLYTLQFENNTEKKPSKYENSAIVFDFEEEKMKFKDIEKAVVLCGNEALSALKEMRKQ